MTTNYDHQHDNTTGVDPLDEHPAKFSPQILDVIRQVLFDEFWRHHDANDLTIPHVLDPFGGIGGIHQLAERPDDWSSNRTPTYQTWAVEIEPPWAAQSELAGPTWCGDWLTFKPTWDGDCRFRWTSKSGQHTAWLDKVDAIATSPTYGNRMADHHNAKDGSRRMTYRHVLRRALHRWNSGQMQWGDEYRWFHRRAWIKARNVIEDGGLLIVNVKDHVRKGRVQHVALWHQECIEALGLTLIADHRVPVKGMRMGENHELRVSYEHVFVFRNGVKS